MFCRTCGQQIADTATFCTNCGGKQEPVPPRTSARSPKPPTALKSRTVAGVLAIFLGGLGVHRFYLGYTGIGVAQILLTLLTCGGGHVWGLIEGVLLLLGKIDRDAHGRPLTD